MIVTYREYRDKTPLGSFFDHSIIGYICSILSPFVSIFCMRVNMRPNTITLFMIITGVIGGVILMLPIVWCKLTAAIIYVLWFTLDCSDGEVARYTQQFSKGGKYLDWCAHLLTHPMFIIGMWTSIIQNYECDFYLLTVITFLFICAELLGRNRISMDTLYGNIANTPYNSKLSMSKAHFFYWQTVYMPNLLLIMPLLLFADLIFQWSVIVYIYIGWALLYSMVMLRVFAILIWRMYKSE